MDEWNGTFEQVDPRIVIVDHRYQRPEKQNLIAAIAANPDWAAFGAISLYRREGMLVCVDGQQRLRGILQSEKPPKTVPAVIQPKANVVKEATTFAAMNITRRPVESMEKHISLVVAEAPASLAIERATKKAGFSLEQNSSQTGDPNTVQAISALYSIYSKLGEEGLVQTLVQARDSWPSDHLGVSAHLLRGVMQVLIDLGEDYNRAKVTTALARSSPSLILRKSEAMRFDFGGSKQKNVRRAIRDLCKI